MLQYNQNSKGATMQNTFLLGITKEVYDIIYQTFPDKNQADGVASIMEKVLLQAEIINQADFQNKLEIIILKVKEKLGEEFATKLELKAALAELELRLTQMFQKAITEVKVAITEVKVEIAEVKAEVKRLDQKIDMVEDKLSQKIDMAVNVLSEKITREIATSSNNNIKWGITTVVGIIIAIIAPYVVPYIASFFK